MKKLSALSVVLALAACVPIGIGAGVARAAPPQPQELSAVFSSPMIINGATTGPDGRLFLPVQPQQPGSDPVLVESVAGKPVPYPDAAWNSWKPGQPGAGRFVGVNAARFGPDGALWVVDRGNAGMDKPLVPGGPKLVSIEVGQNRVSRIIDLSAVAGPKSFIDDIRFNGPHAYLTDAGQPGLIVLDLASGQARRVLDGHPSTVSHKALVAEGRPALDPQGRPVVVHADQLEVSPDGKWFYYQPASGDMARIATAYLNDPALSGQALAAHVERFAATPSTGGTAMDADGNLYVSDTDRSRILKFDAQGAMTVLIADPRLVWVDAMWIDDQGRLLMPAAQLNRTAGFNHGVDAVQRPVVLYRLALGAKPLRR